MSTSLTPVGRERLNFLAQGAVILITSVIITKYMAQDMSVRGFFEAIEMMAADKDFQLLVIIPFLLSFFYFFAVAIRRENQSFGIVAALYLASAAISLFVSIKGMPLVGIYLLLTTIWYFVYAYRAEYS